MPENHCFRRLFGGITEVQGWRKDHPQGNLIPNLRWNSTRIAFYILITNDLTKFIYRELCSNVLMDSI